MFYSYIDFSTYIYIYVHIERQTKQAPLLKKDLVMVTISYGDTMAGWLTFIPFSW